MRHDRNHARAGIGAQVAAGAGAGQQAAFLLQHLFGKAVGRQHQVTLVGVIGPAHGHRIGLHHGAHLACKPLRQLVDGVGFGHERADLVERGQPGTLRFDTPRLGLHLGLQPFVQRLQRCGHSVEAAGHLAEFVLGLDLDPRGKVPSLHLLKALAQMGQRVDHVHVAGEQHHHRADDRQRHHHELEQVENGRQPRELVFDREHQSVDGLDELLRCPGRLGRTHGRHGEPLAAPLGPDPVNELEPKINRLIPGHEQGPHGVARAQQTQALVELVDQRAQFDRVQAGLHRTGQAPGLHAHPPGFVDRRRATFELPGDPQGQADGRERHHQQARANADQLGGQGGGAEHGARLTGLGPHRKWADPIPP